MISWLTSLFRRKRPSITIVKSGWEEPSEPLGFPHEFAKWMSSMYPNGFQDDDREEQSMTDEERIAELDRENAELRHELASVHKALSAVGREKDEVERKLLLQIGSMSAQDAREQVAGDKCGVSYAEHGCDWPDAVADVVLTLRRDAERWRECEWLVDVNWCGDWVLIDLDGDTFAAAIDAAIAKRKATT